MKSLKLNLFAIAVLAMAVSAPFVKAAVRGDAKPPVLYHISASTGGSNPIYTVVQTGSCKQGIQDCQFTTSLAPDQPGGKYSRAYLLANNVTIDLGVFSAQ